MHELGLNRLPFHHWNEHRSPAFRFDENRFLGHDQPLYDSNVRLVDFNDYFFPNKMGTIHQSERSISGSLKVNIRSVAIYGSAFDCPRAFHADNPQ